MDQERLMELHPEAATDSRQPYQEPRLEFVEPELMDRGSLADVTTGFFGTFNP